MSKSDIKFDHIHITSDDPKASAQWYVDILGAEIQAEYELREAPQIAVALGGMKILIRGRRPGESPEMPKGIQHFADYSSHDVWGTDHFGYTYHGDLRAFCDEIKTKGAELEVEPWEFFPGGLICYIAAPDGVSIELIQPKKD